MGIIAKIKGTAEATAAVVVEKADSVRLSRTRAKLEGELGALTYRATRSGDDLSAETNRLIAAIDDLDADADGDEATSEN